MKQFVDRLEISLPGDKIVGHWHCKWVFENGESVHANVAGCAIFSTMRDARSEGAEIVLLEGVSLMVPEEDLNPMGVGPDGKLVMPFLCKVCGGMHPYNLSQWPQTRVIRQELTCPNNGEKYVVVLRDDEE